MDTAVEKKLSQLVAGPYLGFDVSSYPGDTLMQSWWVSSPLWYVGFYLAPAPNHSNTSWMAKRSYLANMGWGFLPTYVGRQVGGSGLTNAQGQSDANNAASLATQAGFPSGTTLFLDVETGSTLPANMISYIQGWVSKIDSGTLFWAGVYCSYSQSAAQIKAALGTWSVKIWCWNVNCSPSPGCTLPSSAPSPSSCGYSGAVVWQYAQSPKPSGISCSGYTGSQCTQSFGGHSLSIDLNTANAANPSA